MTPKKRSCCQDGRKQKTVLRFADALDDGDSSEEEVELPKKAKHCLTMEDLERCGYKERPSILLVPEPQNPEIEVLHVSVDSTLPFMQV